MSLPASGLCGAALLQASTTSDIWGHYFDLLGTVQLQAFETEGGRSPPRHDFASCTVPIPTDLILTLPLTRHDLAPVDRFRSGRPTT